MNAAAGDSSENGGIVVWLLGLSGAGKSTVAALLKARLEQEGIFSILLDGDALRAGINQNLTFSEEDRAENVRRAAEIAKILVNNQVVTICSFITPLEEHRQIAARILGESYYEVFINCPLEVCEERDVKGLYEKARKQHLPNFTGVSAAFEPALNASLTLFTNTQTPEESCGILFENILPKIRKGRFSEPNTKNSHSA